MGGVRAWAQAFLICLLPTPAVRWMVNLMGSRIERGARVGFSLLVAEKIVLRRGARIGHLNFFRISRIVMLQETRVKHLNLVRGPFSFELEKGAIFSSLNRMVRNPIGITIGSSRFRMNPHSGVTSGHYFDLTRPIRIGRHSIIAGIDCQLWTHGYVHDTEGSGRYRIDGGIDIGPNVYVGSRVLISLGVTIERGVVVGAGCVVASNLEAESLYVSAKLRKLSRPIDPDERAELIAAARGDSLDRVYFRRKHR